MLTRLCALLLALALASPAWAGFTVELDGASAYHYTGACTATGAHGPDRTVPRCTGTSDGSFTLRSFTQVLSGAAEFTAQQLRLVTVGDPNDSTAAVCWNIACTATTEGSDPTTVTYNAGSTLAYDMDADSCTAQSAECVTGAFPGPTAIRNLQSGADCAGTTCNNTELICRVQYFGTAGTGCTNGYTGGADVSSVKLDVTP